MQMSSNADRQSCLHCWFLLSVAFFKGRHTGQSCRVQFFQWEMICRDDAQWATGDRRQQAGLHLDKNFNQKEEFPGKHHLPWQDLPAWQWVMWLRTFFIVRQWGSEQALTSPLACSRRWHLCAWSNRTSCCWMSLRFSGSAVGPADTPPAPGTMPTEPTCCCSWGCKQTTKFNQV